MWRLVIDDISEMQPKLSHKNPTRKKASAADCEEKKKEHKYKEQVFEATALNAKKGKGATHI